MLGGLIGGNCYTGGKEERWMRFGKSNIQEFGTKCEGWREAMAGRRCRCIEDGTEASMRRWNGAERRAAMQHAVTAPRHGIGDTSA